MKKFTALSLALFLCFAGFGNQMNLSAMSNPQTPANQSLPRPVLLEEPTALVNAGNEMFQDIVRFKLFESKGVISFENSQILEHKFENFSNCVNSIPEYARRIFSATLLTSPFYNAAIGMVPQEKVNIMMGNLLNGVLNNLESVEWNIDPKDRCGTFKFNMNSIPHDILVPISLFPDLIKVEGNLITLSF